jgi:peptidoglycan hydrolase CwlO-like protein
MLTKTPFFAGLFLLATLAGAEGTKNVKENPAQDRRQAYLETLGKAQTEVKAIGTGVDELLKAVTDAKASGDKAKMKAALDATAKHLTEMKTHVMDCEKHMQELEQSMSTKE